MPPKPVSARGMHDAGRLWLLFRFPEVLFFSFLLIATVAVYSPVRTHEFVNYDDYDYVVHNPHIQTGLNWQSVRWAWTTYEQANWHPVTWMSHAIDCQLFGLDPAGHHLMNLGLHVLNVALLAWLLTAVTGAPRRSILAAALFALHPINVESVAWVAERKNLLSTCFFLLTLAAYGRYVQKPGVARYLGVAAAFALALSSKPMVVTLPFVLLLIDYWPLKRVRGWSIPGDAYLVPQISFARCVVEKGPLLLLSVVSSVVTVGAQGGAVMALDTLPFSERLQNAVYTYVLYLWKAAIPVRLAIFYPHPGNTLGAWRVGLSAIFLLAVSWAVWAARRREPYLIVGWLWFVGTLVPVIGVVQVGAQAMADRYAYVPLIGIFVMAVWGIADWCDGRGMKAQWRIGAAVVVLAALSCMTWKQVGYWEDSTMLWSHALEVTPDNPFSEDQLGMALLAQDRQEDAMKRFQIAIALGTKDPTPYLNVGAYLSEHGQQREAMPLLETALSMTRNTESRVFVHLNLGLTYTSLGDYPSARLHYREAWGLDHVQVTEAIRGLAQFAGTHPSVRDDMKLGLLLEAAGRNAEAEAAFERVLQIDPGVEAARSELNRLKAGR